MKRTTGGLGEVFLKTEITSAWIRFGASPFTMGFQSPIYFVFLVCWPAVINRFILFLSSIKKNLVHILLPTLDVRLSYPLCATSWVEVRAATIS